MHLEVENREPHLQRGPRGLRHLHCTLFLKESWACDLNPETALGASTLYYFLINYASKPEGAIEREMLPQASQSCTNLVSPSQNLLR